MGSANQRLAALEELWTRKRGQKLMPSFEDLALSDLKPWLEDLALIDLNEMGDGTFRLCGSNLIARFGINVMGCRIAGLSDDLVTTILWYLTELRKTGMPTRSVQARMVQGVSTTFDDLALPLSGDRAALKALLFASYLRP